METHGRCPMNGSSRRWPDGFRNDGSLWRLVEIACLTYLLFIIHMRYMHTTYHLLQDWLSCWVHIFLSQRLGRMRILIESDRNDIKKGVWWTPRLIGVILSETLMCDSAPTLRFVDLFFATLAWIAFFMGPETHAMIINYHENTLGPSHPCEGERRYVFWLLTIAGWVRNDHPLSRMWTFRGGVGQRIPAWSEPMSFGIFGKASQKEIRGCFVAKI